MKLSIFSRYKQPRTEPPQPTEPVEEAAGTPVPEAQAPIFHGRNPIRRTNTPSAESPHGRAERVAELRKQVRGGTYDIPISQLVRILASVVLRRR